MTIVYYDGSDRLHSPRTFIVKGVPRQNREVPERAAQLLAACRRAGYEVRPAKDFGMQPIERIHTVRYLDFLVNGYESWSALEGASEEIIPNAFPIAPGAGYPTSIVGRAGFHMGDMACPINKDTWAAAYGSAQSVISGAAELLTGAVDHVYALCRPPGHHAYADRAAGYCFINNAAVAAQFLRDKGVERVSILDIDVHHGNGTQDIFYDRGDVQMVSIHADPAHFYPFFWGYKEQVGLGDGERTTSNFPLPLGTHDDTYLEVLREAMTHITRFQPDALVISLGLDSFKGDPYAAFNITTSGFYLIGAAIRQMKLPALVVQEGGYVCPELGDNLTAFLQGLRA